MAVKGIVADLAETWRRSGRGELSFDSIGGVDAAERVGRGDPYDVVVLATDAIERLARDGSVVAGSPCDIARSPVAIAVRAGAALPDVSSAESLTRALESATSIGYSTGPSGTALLEVLARLGLRDVLRERLVQAPPGEPVAALVTRGAAQIGFQQLSELIDAPGVTVVGQMPEGLEIVTTFSAAICAASRQQSAALEVLRFLASGACAEVKRRHGMTPAAAPSTSI